MELDLKVPVQFSERGKCQLCGKNIGFIRRLFKSGQSSKIHEECYRRAATERKKAVDKYRDALREALLDSVITEEENAALDDLAQKLSLSENELKQIRLLVWHDLYSEATADRVLDEDEDKLLKQAQAELEIPDAEIQSNLSTLGRLRFLRQIRSGDLPVVSADILLKKNEQAHWQCEAEFWEQRVIRRGYEGGSHGMSFRIAKGMYYRVGAHKGQLVTESGIIKIDEGRLVITNKRIVFNGFTKSFSIPFTKLINYVVYQDAIQLDKEGKSKPGYFKVEDPEILACIISGVAQT